MPDFVVVRVFLVLAGGTRKAMPGRLHDESSRRVAPEKLNDRRHDAFLLLADSEFAAALGYAISLAVILGK